MENWYHLPNFFKIIFTDCRAKADMAIILDSSSSVGVANFRKVLNFVVGLLQDANIDNGRVRVALMTFRLDFFLIE